MEKYRACPLKSKFLKRKKNSKHLVGYAHLRSHKAT